MAYGWDYYLDNSCKAQWFNGFRGSQVFDSSLDRYQNLYQGELVGDLQNKNCTTIFHNLPTSRSKLFFRIDCANSLKNNYATGVDVTVKGSYFG